MFSYWFFFTAFVLYITCLWYINNEPLLHHCSLEHCQCFPREDVFPIFALGSVRGNTVPRAGCMGNVWGIRNLFDLGSSLPKKTLYVRVCSGYVCVCVAPTGWAIWKAKILKSGQWSYLSVNCQLKFGCPDFLGAQFRNGDGVLTKIPDLVVIRSLTKIYEEIKAFRAQAKLLVSNWSISAETMASWILSPWLVFKLDFHYVHHQHLLGNALLLTLFT